MRRSDRSTAEAGNQRRTGSEASVEQAKNEGAGTCSAHQEAGLCKWQAFPMGSISRTIYCRQDRHASCSPVTCQAWEAKGATTADAQTAYVEWSNVCSPPGAD